MDGFTIFHLKIVTEVFPRRSSTSKGGRSVRRALPRWYVSLLSLAPFHGDSFCWPLTFDCSCIFVIYFVHSLFVTLPLQGVVLCPCIVVSYAPLSRFVTLRLLPSDALLRHILLTALSHPSSSDRWFLDFIGFLWTRAILSPSQASRRPSSPITWSIPSIPQTATPMRPTLHHAFRPHRYDLLQCCIDLRLGVYFAQENPARPPPPKDLLWAGSSFDHLFFSFHASLRSCRSLSVLEFCLISASKASAA